MTSFRFLDIEFENLYDRASFQNLYGAIFPGMQSSLNWFPKGDFFFKFCYHAIRLTQRDVFIFSDLDRPRQLSDDYYREGVLERKLFWFKKDEKHAINLIKANDIVFLVSFGKESFLEDFERNIQNLHHNINVTLQRIIIAPK